MLSVILSLIGVGIAIGVDKARVHKASEEICKEKGWGDYRDPRSNEKLQRRYFISYVECSMAIDPHPIYKPDGTVFGNPYNLDYVPDPDHPWESKMELMKTIASGKPSVGGVRISTRYDRYCLAVEDFEKLGYVWDDRYNPNHI